MIPVIGVAKTPSPASSVQPYFTVVLNELQDFGNIDTIIRTCQAFGIKDVLYTSSDFDIYQRKTIEASRGSVFSTRLKNFANDNQAKNYLRKQGYQIVATSLRGTELQSLIHLKQQPVALVVGNESTGISKAFEKNADFLVKIPMFHTVESLNVGVATGISIYELKLKQVLAMIEERIKSTLGREVNVAGMLVQRALDAELNKVTELTSQQVVFMMVLKCDLCMQIADMCKQFGILEKEAGTFLKPMLMEGLVTHTGDLQLTSKGEEVLSRLWFTIENTESKILSGLTNKQVSELMLYLRKIQEQCVSIIKGE